MSVWMSIADHYCAVDRRSVVHAVSATDYYAALRARRERRSRRKTYDAVCGKRFVKLRGHRAVMNGESDGTIVAVWPPPVAWLAEDGEERCRECWVRTGKKLLSVGSLGRWLSGPSRRHPLPALPRSVMRWLVDTIDQEMVDGLGEMQDERDVVMALRGAVKQLPALIEVAAAARAMVEDGFPHTGAGDEWFDIVCGALAALDTEDNQREDAP